MFATASIVAGVHPDALYVPAAAITTPNNQPTMFVVRTDSTVEQRTVQTGWRDGDRVEVLNAKKGEVVVTTGSYGLSDKMHVTVKKTAPASQSS
jgi:multidrug efflux pump subunit AcrA (membrane-fusion protein)